MPLEQVFKSVVQVTAGGRGVIVQGITFHKYIVTASHCLPHMPPRHPFSYDWERTYQAVLGPLGEKNPTISAECLFVDPVSDLALLCEPPLEDDQWEAHIDLVEEAPVLSIRRAQDGEEAWLLALDGKHLFRCKAQAPGTGVWIVEAEEPILSGMSGSPIFGADGEVIGVCCVSSGGADLDNHREGGPNPGLLDFPAWFVEMAAGMSLSPRLSHPHT